MPSDANMSERTHPRTEITVETAHKIAVSVAGDIIARRTRRVDQTEQSV